MKWKIMFSIMLLLLLSSCDMKDLKVSDQQFKEDISKLDSVINGCVTPVLLPQESYVMDDCIITKRQTNPDNKEDIIYCDVTISNSYIRTVIEYKLEYNFYDEGDWILDDAEILEYISEPLAGADPTLANVVSVYSEKDWQCKAVPSLYSFSHQETDLEAQLCTLYYTCISDNYSAKASCPLIWSQENGWIPATAANTTGDIRIGVYEAEIDWKELLVGTWYNEGEAYENYFDTLIIEDVDDRMNVTGSYIRTVKRDNKGERKGDWLWKVTFVAPLDPATGIIDAFPYGKSYYNSDYYTGATEESTDLELHYNMSTNEWALESLGMFGYDKLILYPSS